MDGFSQRKSLQLNQYQQDVENLESLRQPPTSKKIIVLQTASQSTVRYKSDELWEVGVQLEGELLLQETTYQKSLTDFVHTVGRQHIESPSSKSFGFCPSVAVLRRSTSSHLLSSTNLMYHAHT
ncbi:hypothetical protein K7X08_029274 [Anisodus acutangulus]|uniref:Uncharacterized protein n=1 Tax=Anisodus acutangulus TaxID=402998 RepID=A0A9Q1L208_9SOLA|nr:hypothetical protein K7X08_029274 [Anisodus acutangulus]